MGEDILCIPRLHSLYAVLYSMLINHIVSVLVVHMLRFVP